MTLLEFIDGYLGLPLFSKLIERRKPIHSPIYERVFPHRVPRSVTAIRLSDITRKIHAMPVIARGGMAIPLDERSGATMLIEPLSIRLRDMITGARLNDLRSLYGDGGENGQNLVQAELDKMVEDLMKSTEATRNALCAQALTGKIDYQMDSNGKKERYEIKYGDTLTHNPDSLLNAYGHTLIDLFNLLNAMKNDISTKGYSGTVEVQAGPNAFSVIANLILSTRDTDRMGAKIENSHIGFMGYDIYLNNATYTDRNESGADVTKNEVDTNKIVMYIPDMGEVDYCAIDDVRGGLQATPFWAQAYEMEDPSGYKIISESKPLPIIAAESICWSTITDGPSLKDKEPAEEAAKQAK